MGNITDLYDKISEKIKIKEKKDKKERIEKYKDKKKDYLA